MRIWKLFNIKSAGDVIPTGSSNHMFARIGMRTLFSTNLKLSPPVECLHREHVLEVRCPVENTQIYFVLREIKDIF